MSGETNTDDKTTRPGNDNPGDAFHDALARMWVECHYLSAALARDDDEESEIAAKDAVTHWLTAQQLLQHLELRHRERAEMNRELWEAQRVVDELFASIARRVDRPALSEVFERLRSDITTTRADQ